MTAATLPEQVKADLERIGAAELIVGLATDGPSPTVPAVAAAIRAGLDTHFPGHAVAVIHVDSAASAETVAQLTPGLGDLRTVHVRPPHHSTDVELERSEAVERILDLGRRLEARAIVVLNSDSAGTTADWVQALGEPVLKEGYGFVLPIYQRNRYEGTLTQTVVVPFVRALFGRQLVHPLAGEFACSGDAADFLLKQDVWSTDLGRHGLEFWLPVAAMERRLPLGQAVLGRRIVSPQRHPEPLGHAVGRVANALFSLAERFETAWLDVRGSEAVRTFGAPSEPLIESAAIDPERMQVGFRQGVRDLLPIWERILAPENLGDVLALGERSPERFRFRDRLWARVVYDFLLAYRTRVVYRSHVAQALAPLYLGRAASLVLETRHRPVSAMSQMAERLGRAFEEEKPYLVDRWR